MRRLEIIADTFLSMNAPVQHALPGWLAGRHSMQRQIRERAAANLETLDRAIAGQHAMARLACEGGWYVTLRTPPSVSGEKLAIRLIENCGVAVHPGEFFGFAERNRLVASLLPTAAAFGEGVRALMAETGGQISDHA
jgi:aspartate/methionine/tyrosine aminotransferase